MSQSTQAGKPACHLALEPPADGVRGVATGLDRNLRHSRQLAETHQVADHEHLGMARKRAVPLYLYTARPIEVDARRGGQEPTERRGLDPRGPDLRRRLDPPQSRIGRVRIEPALVDVGNQGAQMDLDSYVSQVPHCALS